MRRRPVVIAAVLWGLLVHALLAGLLLRTDALERIGRRLGHPPPEPEITALYREMVAYHARGDAGVPDGAVIVLGDSHVQGLAVTAIAPGAVNYGIGMDTTWGLLQRLPQHAGSLGRARAIVLAIGVNDLLRTGRDDAAIRQLRARLVAALPADVPLLIGALLPVDASRLRQPAGLNARIDALNATLAADAEAWRRQGRRVAVVDAGPALRDATGGLAPAWHLGDGLHLNAAGNAIWAAALRRGLDALAPPGPVSAPRGTPGRPAAAPSPPPPAGCRPRRAPGRRCRTRCRGPGWCARRAARA